VPHQRDFWIRSPRPTRREPALSRIALKMATGSGKTTVMAMLIAWQAVNAARKELKDFSRAFLIVTPASRSRTGSASCNRAMRTIIMRRGNSCRLRCFPRSAVRKS